MKFDESVSSWIQIQFRSTMEFWWLISSWGLYIYAVVVVGLFLIIDEKHRVLMLVAPAGFVFVLSLLLQKIFRRSRPKITKTTYDLFIQTYSFPSAHAATSMAFASSLAYVFINSYLEYGWLFAFAFFLLACLIAISRVVVGVHYATDILAGAFLGYVIAYLFFV